jgi:hypothetical protein
VIRLNDFQFENLIKSLESTFKQNYCAMRFEEISRKYAPEITSNEVKAALEAMRHRGKLIVDGSILRLIIR